MTVLGVIEGFYGQPWGWSIRHEALPFFQEWGFSLYLYAPKSDRRLRKEWRLSHEEDEAQALKKFGEACAAHGIRWGVGLTPLSLHESWDANGRRALAKRLSALAALKMDHLAILFDDMPGNFPDLAKTQGDILKFVADQGVASQLSMCPTYYSDASILDRLFGDRPENYLKDLGHALDDSVQVFWTGPGICSSEYPSEHLERVTDRLGRKPFIWDNYPVNDGPRMCRFLHLQSPQRPKSVMSRVSGLMVNPMNQHFLSRVALVSMSRSLGGTSGAADVKYRTEAAIQQALPGAVSAKICRDWSLFQERGLDEIEEHKKIALINEYREIDHPAAAEVVQWLEGKYVVSKDILTDC